MSAPTPSNQWTTGLCDCHEDPANSCASSGLIYALILYCLCWPCCYSCSYRTRLRSQFNLVEKPCGDCLVHCFCELCALCQEYRELKNRGFDPALGWAGNAAGQEQQQGVPMTPPMGQAMHK
eukprot:Gb_14595 [translate_table: standard]